MVDRKSHSDALQTHTPWKSILHICSAQQKYSAPLLTNPGVLAVCDENRTCQNLKLVTFSMWEIIPRSYYKWKKIPRQPSRLHRNRISYEFD